VQVFLLIREFFIHVYKPQKMPRHNGGKLPAGMKKYPNIMAYLRTKHAAVADVLDDLFMSRALVPRAKTGRTFLVPDAALMKKITAAFEKVLIPKRQLISSPH